MMNPMKMGRNQMLKLVPNFIKYLEQAKRNGTMSKEKADKLIAQLKEQSEEVIREGENNDQSRPASEE